MSQVYRSPSSGSAAAAVTPARLADDFGSVVWRHGPDGQLEVARLRDGYVERYAVHDDGSTTLIESSPPPAWRPWLKPLMIAAVLLVIAGVVGVAATDSDKNGWPAPIGIVLAVVAAIARERALDLRTRLGKKSDWHEPTNLHGWVPRSSAQLAAAERIADDHDGVAFVRDLGSRTADVVAMRAGRFEQYWVDELGNVELVESKPPSIRHFVDKALQGLAMALWIGLVAVGLAVDTHKGMLVVAALGALAAVMLAGWRNERANSLEQRVQRLSSDGQPWLEIRTVVPESDD